MTDFEVRIRDQDGALLIDGQRIDLPGPIVASEVKREPVHDLKRMNLRDAKHPIREEWMWRSSLEITIRLWIDQDDQVVMGSGCECDD
jgi:hypothetical protein